jgi:mRNA interferase MazF
MRRGEVWMVGGGADDAGKPRPAVIVQDNRFDATASVTIWAFATDPTDAPLLRLAAVAALGYRAERGQRSESGLTAVGRQDHDGVEGQAGFVHRRLGDEDIVRLNRAIVVFLGLAG